MTIAFIDILALVVILCAGLGLGLFLSKNPIHAVRGPPSPSLLIGHHALLRHAKAGELERKWAGEYGLIYRLAGVFTEPFLMVIDPKALQHIFNSGYNFPKSREADHVTTTLFGQGLVAVAGLQHQRQRRILNPAFSESQLRQLLPLLQDTGAKVVQRLHENLNGEPKVLDVLKWTNKVALDIVGITSFRYHFGTLDGEESEFAASLDNIFADAQLNPSTFEIVLVHGILRQVPSSLLALLEKIPSRETRRFKQFRTRMATIAGDIYEKQVKAVEKEHDKDALQKDIVTLLALSSLSNDEKKHLDYIEIVSQMATFIFGGHDTTAAAIAWLLYEMAANPEDQAKIRQEIFTTSSEGKLTTKDYDSLQLLNAAIKESLRLHPFVHTLFRTAAHDDVLPLSEPIKTTDGRIVTEIPIRQGQLIYTSLFSYNRLPSVWGADADRWNPSRFLDTDKSERPSIGMLSNLLTFSSGVRGCIGYRFAIMEIQTIIVELLSAFEFALPDGGLNLQQGASFQVLFPMLEGKFHEGSQIPLKLSALKRPQL